MVPRRVKAIATLSIVTSFVISAVFITSPLVLTLLAIGMVILVGYLLTRNDESSVSVDSGVNLKHNHEWRPQVS